MSDDDLTIEQSWRGNFWLPATPDNTQPGFLTYTPTDGVTLSLVGGFDDRRKTRTSPTGFTIEQGSGRFAVIHGAVGSGVPVTLADCRSATWKMTGAMDEVRGHDITAAHILMGVLLDDPDAALFSELAIELENLTEWDHHDEVTIHGDVSHSTPQETKWKVEIDAPKLLTVSVGELTVELVRRTRQPDFHIRRERLDTTAAMFSYFNIRSARPKSMTEWFEVTKALQDLLTLAMDAPCALLSESLTPSQELLADEKAHTRSTIDLFAKHILTGDREADGVSTAKGLFSLGSEGVEFRRVMTEWFRIHDDFRATCDMIFGLKYVKDGYAQTKLITAVAAAESLHEALGLAPPISDEEFAERRKTLMASVPKHQREWLHQKLGNNAPTLRQRLLDLAAIPDDEIMALILPNPEAWAKATKDERNPVAHGGNMTRDIQLLNAIITTTTAVVLLNLLHQLGIPKERVRMAIDYNRTLKSARYLATKQWPTPADHVTNG